jgi:hypothetical protein
MGARIEAADDEVGDDCGDILGVVLAVGSEPMRRPVEGAEKSARGDVGIRCRERAVADAVGDERTDTALVAIPFCDDERAKPAGQGIHFEMRGGAFDVVEETQNVGFGELSDAVRERTVAAPRVREGSR